MVPSSLACGMCIMEGWQVAFPATIAWCVIGPAWYLALGAFARLNDLELWGMGSFLKCFGLVAAGLLLCVLWFGPFTLLPFGLLAAPATVQYFKAAGALPPGARFAGHSIGAAAVLALGISAAWGIAVLNGPATVDTVLRRQSNPDARQSEFHKLRLAEPGSLPIYRELTRLGTSTGLLEESVGRVEALGTPGEVVPWLIDMLEVRLRDREDRQAGVLEKELRRISGCEPEPGSGIKGWREAWNRKQGR